MRISQYTSASHTRTHTPAASHLLSCQIRGVSDLCWESLKSSRLRKRRVLPAKQLSAGFARAATRSSTSSHVWQTFRNEFVCVRCRHTIPYNREREEAFECMHACENFNNGGEISPSSKTSLISWD